MYVCTLRDIPRQISVPHLTPITVSNLKHPKEEEKYSRRYVIIISIRRNTVKSNFRTVSIACKHR